MAWTAAALMTVGLLAKTALFPLHLWLPPAHAGAPAAASAVLSALVVKGAWFLVVRLWLDVFAGVVTACAAAQLLAALGASAILVGNVVALRQARLKLLIAYSTVAQIGYLFLMFPLVAARPRSSTAPRPWPAACCRRSRMRRRRRRCSWPPDSIYATLGHDRVAGPARRRARPADDDGGLRARRGIALMGVQPSGASLAKELLLQDTARTGQWWWAVVLQAGGMFTTAYVVLVLSHAFAPSDQPIALIGPAPLSRDLAALALALCSLFLGLLPWDSYLPVPYDATSKLFGIDALSKLLLPVLGGAALAILLSPWPHPLGSSAAWKALMRVVGPLRRGCLRFGSLIERGDEVLRQWSAAGISLLLVSLLLAASMFAAN